uniref:Sig2B n=1 Tax=Arundo donax TaxID=35708 RepID=A0A0A9HGI2_ARUDO
MTGRRLLTAKEEIEFSEGFPEVGRYPKGACTIY